MNINIDPVVAGRMKKAWNALPAEKRSQIAPLFAQANQAALTAAQTKRAPTALVPGHEALLAVSALTHDGDGVLANLEPGIVFDIDAEGAIWGTGKYQQLDPGWALSTACWLEHLLIGKHAFNNVGADSILISDNIQIAIAGDWGTGNWRTAANPSPSDDVASHLARLAPDVTIHLGDVYYAGTGDEESHLFTDIWPAGTKGSFTLNSNHEMYSGATPYFDVALANDKFSQQKGSSFFALENSNWIIVGLDSAYYSNELKLYLDGALQDDSGATVQVDFLKKQVVKGKQIILLTHHNGLSGDGSKTNLLWTQVMSAFPPGSGPAYWYWGHIHAGIVYQPNAISQKIPCRCCGHGAIPWGPASELENNPNILWYERRLANDPDVPRRVLNGFCTLNLSGKSVQETLWDENGGVAWQSP